MGSVTSQPAPAGAMAPLASGHPPHWYGSVNEFANATSLAIIITDADGLITFWNPAAAALFGYAFAEVRGRDVSVIIPERLRGNHTRGIARVTEGHEPRLHGKAVEVVGLHRDGHEIPIELSLSAWPGPAGWEFAVQVQDISARHARDTKLRHLAVHDPVTGLPNRQEFIERLSAALDHGGAATVLLMDLAGLKNVNETLGHATGDDLLRIVSVRLAGRLPHDTLLARLGGDKFAVLLAETNDPAHARGLGQALVAAFDQDFPIGGHELRLSARVGIALAPLHAADPEELLARADLALIEAKRHPDNAVKLFDRNLDNKLLARRAFRDEVREATVAHQWELHYQPQVALADDSLVGAEALLRWRHPRRGLILPAVFIETLEKHVTAAEVGRWTLDQACAQLVAARHSGLALDSVSVNLFAIQLRSSGIERTVHEVLGHHGLEPGDLELELTETVVLQQNTRSLAELRALRRAGVRLAFDDFGTGFASLSTFKNLAVDKLKIDRSFVAGLARSPRCRAITGSIIYMARELGLELVAEGVETPDQREALIELGCTTGQGFLWGRPASLIQKVPVAPATAPEATTAPAPASGQGSGGYAFAPRPRIPVAAGANHHRTSRRASRRETAR